LADKQRVDEFLRLYSRHYTHLQTFVLSLVPNWNDAEEILQESSSVLWAKFGQFEEGTNFLGWACRIARFEAYRHFRSQKREHTAFSESFADLVASETVQMAGELDRRREALAECVSKLRENERELLRLRYEQGYSGSETASQVGRSIHAVYKSMKIIRNKLYQCVQGKLGLETSL